MLPHDDKHYDDNDNDNYNDDVDNRQQDEQDDDDAALNAFAISKTADHEAPFSYCPRHVCDSLSSPTPSLFLSLSLSLCLSLSFTSNCRRVDKFMRR